MSWKTRLHTHFSKLAASVPKRKAASTARTLDVLDLEDRVMYSAVPIDVAGLVEGLDTESLNAETQYDGFEVREPFITYLDQPTELQDEAPPEQDAVQQSPDDLTADDPITEAEDDILVSPEETPQRHELVFIDAAVEDVETLLEDLQLQSDSSRQLSYVLLESGTDGIAQISAELADRDGVDAVHIVSHGSESGVRLGDALLTLDSLDLYRDDLAIWNDSIEDGGDLLFYGCDLAASDEGRALMEQIATACDCDVAASDDVTGHESLGGDWDLEFHAGLIQASNAFSATAQAHWLSTLDITSNLVAHYEFEENTGTTAGDSTANNNDGTLTNGPTWDSDSAVGGYSIDFTADSGGNSYVSVPDDASLDISGDFSVAFWYNATVNTGSNQQFVGQYSVGDGFFIYATSSGNLQFLVDGASGIVNNQYAGAFINDGSWYHVVAVRSGDNFQMYLNGVANTASTSAIGSVTSTQPFLIGGTSSSDYDGKLDEVRLYTRALSSSDVTELYNYSGASPQTFTVTNINDSGAGSLRQAIIDANTSTGTLDTIEFNISGSGPHTISLSTELPAFTDAVFVDGWSEPDYASDGVPVIVIDGTSAGASADGLDLDPGSDGSTIRGLVIQNFQNDGIEVSSDNNWIYGNYIGVDVTGLTTAGGGDQGIDIFGGATGNRIGTDDDGTNDAFERNIIGGMADGITIVDVGTSNNIIAGNYIGVGIDGVTVVANTTDGVRIGNSASSNTIGGNTLDLGNVIAGNGDEGIQVQSEDSDNNIIQNNYIGVSADGTTNIGNGEDGISIITGADNSQILNNWITGSGDDGISLDGNGSPLTGSVIQGNRIGTDASGTLNWGNGGDGIFLQNDADSNTIGGVGAGEGNIVAYSGRHGVLVETGNTANPIRGNAIYRNTGLGIDLSATTADDGFTPNDAGDSDTGGNNLQNWAVLTSAAIAGDGMFSYDLNTTTLASGSYTVDFYASTDRDFGQVEGERYLGSLTGVADGNSSLTGTLSSITLASGEYITLITTDASGNSSEFSNYAVTTDSDAGGATPSDLLGIATSGGGLSINHDGGNDTYLLADDGGAILGGLTRFTYEIQFSSNDNTGESTLLSYAASDVDDNELIISISSSGALALNIDNLRLDSNAMDYRLLRDGNQHSIAVTWDNLAGDWEVFVDGVSIDAGTGHRTGYTIASGGTLLFGQEQDLLEGSFSSGQTFEGTLHDLRIFDDVRTAEEIAAGYRSDLPYDEAGMIANWRFDDLSSDGIITESVSGNNLTVKHTSESGFTASSPELTYSLDENAIDGTVVGSVVGVDAERDAQIASLLAADPELRFSAETGKFYKLLAGGEVDHATALTNASGESLSGIAGQLVTIKSANENAYVSGLAGGVNVWLGATDEVVENEWRWNDDGELFWLGRDDGYSPDSDFTAWQSTQPNGSDYLLLNSSLGTWNDVDALSTQEVLVQWDADDVLDATQALTYSITSQSVAGAFEVDADTGEIRVADGTLLNADTLATHTVTIRATDVAANTYDEAFSISLNNLAEDNNAPTGLSSGIELNTDGGNDAYLIANDGGAILGGLTEFTFETKFQTTYSGDVVFVSYAAGVSSGNDLFIRESGGVLSLFVHNIARNSSAIDYSILKDGNLHTLAVTWDNTNGDWAFYVDGELTDSGSGLKVGHTMLGSPGTGEIVFGQEQDSIGGGFSTSEIFSGTLYDVRIWDEVRSEAEIALNYQHKFDSGSLPGGLVANWQMDGFNGSSEVVDVVSANNLSIGHATGTGFVASTPVEDLHISENAVDGTTVGFVVPSDPDSPQDVVSDGLFLETDPSGFTTYSSGQSFGGWTVESGEVVLNDETIFESSPLGGYTLELGTVNDAGVISQSLTTEAGRTYQVVFALSGDWSSTTDAKSLRVSAGGESQDFTADYDGDWAYLNMLWGKRSFTFTADAGTTLLQFSSLEGASNNSAVIADVQVVEEPHAVTTILNNDPTLSYDAATGKFYRVVDDFITWNASDTAARSSQVNGVDGQLAVVRSAYENELIRNFARSINRNVWLGATDVTTEGTWRWQEGGTDGDHFWTGDNTGSAQNGHYTNFASGEPNASAAGEDYLQLYQTTGEWNDGDVTFQAAYVIEWDASQVLSNFTFSLTDNAGGRFAIDDNTGEITVADGSLLDYETATSHNVTVETTDAAGNIYSEAMTIEVNNLGGEPYHTVPIAQSVNEDTSLVFSTAGGNAITIDDTGTDDTRLQVELSVTNGTLTLAQTTGLTIVEGTNGSASMILQGTESDLNAALDGLQYDPTANYNGSDTLVVTTSLGSELEGHYTFEGGNANDQSAGTAEDGTLIGDATTVVDGVRGEVLSLDGAGDYVQVSGLFGNPGSVTLAAWVNPTAVNGEVISLGDNVFLRVDDVANGTGVKAGYYDGATFRLTSTATYIVGTGWRHLAYTLDSATNTQTLYLDGVAIATTNFTQSVSYTRSGTDTGIGVNANSMSSKFFNGLIDDAFIYNRALSADEIVNLAGDNTSYNDNVAITVNAVNDAPTITNGYTYNLPGTDEDTNSAGTLVSTILAASGYADVDVGALSGIAITAKSGSGAWQYSTDGVTWTIFGPIGASSSLLLSSTTQVRYSPDWVSGETATFDYRAWDQTSGTASTNGSQSYANITGTGGSTAYSSNLSSAQIVVTEINDQPAGTDNTVTTNEDTDYAFAAGDFGFSDTDGNSLSAVVISTLPSNGTLYLDSNSDGVVDGGEAISATDVIAVADITAGRLKFKPAANANGTSYDSFTFQVRDDGGTANGGVDTDQTPNTMTIDVNSVNDEPAGADNTVTTNEDTDYAFAAGDFGFSDPIDGDTLSAVVITTIPTNGTLYLDANSDGVVDGGEAISATDVIAVADITAGRLKFKPAANASGVGYDSFTFQVRDDGGTANGGVDTDPTPNTMTIDVNSVNDEPAGADNTVTTNEDTDYAFATGDFGFSDTDGNSLSAVVITTIPTNGTLYLDANSDGNIDGGEAVTASQAIAVADITAGRLKFKPAANANGTSYDSFTFQVRDDGGTANGGVDTDQTPNTMTIDVNSVNDQPAGADNTVTTNEDTDYAFAAGDFGFSDPIDGDSLSAVVISTLLSNGTLYLDANSDGNVDGGEAVSASQAIAVADITAGRLKFKPAANANGTSYDSFTFQVRDDGGTANGGVDTDQTPNTMTIDVNSVNDEPAGTDNTVTTNEDTDYAFASGDFGFSDPIDGDSLSAVVITTIPTNGTLYLDANSDGNIDGGEAVSTTQAIAVADITAGRLKFKAAANANGVGYDSFTFQVRDDGGTANGGVDTDQTPNTMTIDVTAVNDDPFNAGSLPTDIAVTEDVSSDVNLSLVDLSDVDSGSGSLTLTLTTSTGGNLSASSGGGVTVSGSGTGTLTLDGTLANLNAFLDNASNIQYLHGTPGTNGDDADTIQVEITDNGNAGSGGGGTINLGTTNVDIGTVNDPPVNTVPGTQSVLEETPTAIAGISVADSDAGGNLITTRLQVASGVLDVTLSGSASISAGTNGTGDFTIQGSQTDINATLASLTYTGNTDVTGVAADTLVVTTNDQGNTGSGGPLQDIDNVQIDIVNVNDAPSGTDNTVTTNEDADYVFATGDFGYSDPVEGDALAAVVITTIPANGTLYLDANSDGNVDGGEAVSASQTITVADITAGRLKFKPAANANGVGYDSFTFQVRDDGGTANSGVDTDQTPNTMTIDVNSVNDEPAGADNTVTTNEDTDYAFATGDFGFSDTDGNSLSAVVITTIPTNGTLYLDANSDGNIDGGEAVTASQAIAVADITAGRLKFKPAANANGVGYDSFTFQVRDDGGTANGGVDTDQSPNTMTIDVNSVNDEPAGADNTVTTNEDTDYAFAAGDFGFSDTDGNSLSAVVITTIPTNGTLYLDANSDGNVDGGEAVTATQAIAVADITAGRLKFKPAANANGVGYDSFTFQVRDDGGTANGGVDTDQSPNTMTIDVTAVNDDPINSGTLPSDIAVTEDVTSNVDLSLIDLADLDAGGGNLTVTLTTSTGGNLSASSGGGVTVGGSGTGLLTLSGNVANLNTYLDSASNINYLHGTPGISGDDADTIQIDVTDNGNSGSGGGGTINLGTVNVDIGQVNDPPVNAVPGTQTVLEETTTAISGMSIGDPDAGGNNLTTRLQVSSGVLNVSLSGSATIVAGTSGSADLTIQGSQADINATLASLTYTGNTDVVGVAADLLTVTTNDLGNIGSGGPLQDVDTVQINITNVNDVPVGVSESFTTPNTQTLTVAAPGLLANDYDIDSPTLTAVIVSAPSQGTLTLMADGSFVFQPSPAYFGPVQFTYVASDGSLVSSPVTVTIDTTVAPGNPSDPEDPGDPDDGGGDDTTQPEDPVQEPTPVISPTPPPIDARPPQLAPPPSPSPVTPEPPAESRQQQGFDTISTDDTPREDEELSTSGSRISSFAHSGWSRPELSPLERSVYGTQETATYNLDLIEHWLDAAEEEQPVEDTDSLNVGTATSLAIGLSAGYIAWTIRGAYLVAAMAGALPTWVRFDPIYVLDDPEFNRKQRQNSDPDASLADLVQSLGAVQ